MIVESPRIQLIDFDPESFLNKNLVVLEKLDGECIRFTRHKCLTPDELGMTVEWRDIAANLWNAVKHTISHDEIIYNENMRLIHNIKYDRLNSLFYVFMIVKQGKVLSWNEMVEYCNDRGLLTVPKLTSIKAENKDSLRAGLKLSLPSRSFFGEKVEGYVVRNADAFSVEEFDQNVAKWIINEDVSMEWCKKLEKARVMR